MQKVVWENIRELKIKIPETKNKTPSSQARPRGAEPWTPFPPSSPRYHSPLHAFSTSSPPPLPSFSHPIAPSSTKRTRRGLQPPSLIGRVNMMKHHQRNELMKPSFISTDIYICMHVCMCSRTLSTICWRHELFG